eukprot:TRINITY_DN5909_c0_g1_i1.p1 TRINITY_DN5909_c0_g1~~TRINITY_DN5909_c0_g1_i1.p1  ORF type:complete len:216 (-),score=62.56 TRINITY_DN5909_c0_g1_i1:95-742(-)
MSQIDFDKIICRRVIAKDLVLKKLTKHYFSFYNTLLKTQSDAERAKLLTSLLVDVKACELQLGSAAASTMTSQKEVDLFTTRKQETEKSMELKKQEIECLKVELTNAQSERAHREKCEEICLQIRKFPSREEHQRMCEATQHEIEQLEKDTADIKRKTEEKSEKLRECVAQVQALHKSWNENEDQDGKKDAFEQMDDDEVDGEDGATDLRSISID